MNLFLRSKGGLEANINELESLAKRIRGTIIQMSYKAQTSHLGSSLSCVDILVAAYWGTLNVDPFHPDDPNRDRFILSKGHGAAALYAVLAYRGFFPVEQLGLYAQPGSCLPEHPVYQCAPGVEVTTGSLGHGLSLGLGMALAGRIREQSYRVFVVLGDGECNEGSVWEAALFTPARGLDNIVAIIDYNKWQATGRTNEIMALGPLRQKWQSFGWSTYEVNGHDLSALVEAFKKVPDGSGKPVAVIAHTVKGKGVSFMEDDNNWHYRIPDAEELHKARVEIGLL